MAYIVSYLKASDDYTTYLLNMPEGSVELCTIDGVTYVSIPEGETLPDDQPAQILASIQTPEITRALADQIKRESTHVHLIDSRVKAMIAEQYSMEDEIKLIRTAPSEEFDIYNDYAEACRQWGQDQKAALGIVEAS